MDGTRRLRAQAVRSAPTILHIVQIVTRHRERGNTSALDDYMATGTEG